MCETCKKIASLVKREQKLRDAVMSNGDRYMDSHGKACEAVWSALHRLADGHPDVVPSEETKTEKIIKQTRSTVVKELKKELPALIQQALEGLDRE